MSAAPAVQRHLYVIVLPLTVPSYEDILPTPIIESDRKSVLRWSLFGRGRLIEESVALLNQCLALVYVGVQSHNFLEFTLLWIHRWCSRIFFELFCTYWAHFVLIVIGLHFCLIPDPFRGGGRFFLDCRQRAR